MSLDEEEMEESRNSEEETSQKEGPSLNFDDAQRYHANFCAFGAQGDEVLLNFGTAFQAADELDVDVQILTSLQNARQMHQALGRLLGQIEEAAQQ